MVYTADLAEEEVKNLCRKECLPESDEVETERYTSEAAVSFYGTQNSFGNILRLKYRIRGDFTPSNIPVFIY